MLQVQDACLSKKEIDWTRQVSILLPLRYFEFSFFVYQHNALPSELQVLAILDVM